MLLPSLLGSYFVVQPTLETSESPYPGDSVDDIAIWVNSAEPSQSLILATLKASNQQPVKDTGILVYTLDGKQVQFLPGGTPNNIDIRYTNDGQSEIIAVSHWFSGKVTLHSIDHEKMKISEPFDTMPDTGVPRLGGICMYQTPHSKDLGYVVNGKDGDIALIQIPSSGGPHKILSRFKLDSGTEGCVIDDANRALYIAEESTGVWRFDLSNNTLEAPELVVETGLFEPLTPDVEGLTLYEADETHGYLIISSQGNDEYAIIDRANYKHIANFTIKETTANIDTQNHTNMNKAGKNIDGTSHTDGIDLTTIDLGDQFPEGVFIAQDDSNTSNDRKLNQNFKLVPLERILDPIKLLKND